MTGAHAASVLAIYQAGIEEGNATFETFAPGWAAFTAAERAERGAQAGCIAGAPSFAEYRGGLARAGFTSITIAPAQQAGDGVHSAIIRAVKP